MWFLLTVAASVLVYGLLTSDFRIVYVAAHSNRSMPVLYKFAAWWGGQEGSLLLWSWLLATYSAIVLLTNRHQHRGIMPYVTATLMSTQVFFLILNAFVANPFKVLAVGREITSVAGRQRAESAAAVLGDGDTPAHALPGLRGVRGPLRLRDGRVDHP